MVLAGILSCDICLSLSLSLSKPDALARSRGRAVLNCQAWQTYTYKPKIKDKIASCCAYVLVVIGIHSAVCCDSRHMGPAAGM
jgi:hypothetical protein